MDVDTFLASIRLPDSTENRLADDFHELHTVATPSYRPRRGPIIFTAPPPWSWTGRLTIGTETVCERVCISDATSPVQGNRPRISSFLPSKKDLNFPKFYDTADLRLVLRLCKRAQQFARLFSKEESSLDVLVEYMGRQHLAAVLPAIWDDDEVIGYLFLVPPTAEELLLAMSAPRYEGNDLTVALLFTDIRPTLEKRGSPFVVKRALLSVDDWKVSRRTDHEYHLALNLTRLSADARKWAFFHPSIIWPGGDFGWETLTLKRALSHCRAGFVEPAAANPHVVGSVFIHVGALQDIHKLPHLAALRKRVEVRFYLYGTHPRVSPAMWGLGARQVFLLGGIVTFSPAALARDAWGVLDTIRNVHAHPLWACYVLPQVLGLALRLVQTPLEDDLTQEEYRGAVPVGLDGVLNALLDGQIALMSTDNFARLPPDKSALVEFCSVACDAAFGKLDTLTLDTVEVEARARVQIYADMRRLQVQPAFLKLYRRYVVLDLDSREDEGGIEWDIVGKLDFQEN
ncbi:hypothetical protein FB45DRAFT_28378 [Roridomyces roridus]|uniref:Uncharacterized protein n=1 Tax=Roridomyces roridus TaxID=1738132 RepID=A0AAD7CKB7_9AGAR|nr:hypothetical protein FB45DRAFT_28378 [Roridomyces roridus]